MNLYCGLYCGSDRLRQIALIYNYIIKRLIKKQYLLIDLED